MARKTATKKSETPAQQAAPDLEEAREASRATLDRARAADASRKLMDSETRHQVAAAYRDMIKDPIYRANPPCPFCLAHPTLWKIRRPGYELRQCPTCERRWEVKEGKIQ